MPPGCSCASSRGEQSVRARLRYLQSKGVENHEKTIITPKVLGYDRRTKYYSEENVERLRNILIGPMLPEFAVYEEELPILEEIAEINIRPATIDDIEAISKLMHFVDDGNGEMLHNPIDRMLKEPNCKSFVAITPNNEIVDWSQGKISFASSVATGAPAGSICFFVNASDTLLKPIVRLLIHRAHRWLRLRNSKSIILEIPGSMKGLEEYLISLILANTRLFIIN